MKALALLPAALLLTGVSDGARPVYSGPPPSRYMPAEAVTVTIYSNTPEIACGGPYPDKVIYGCHQKKENLSVIVLPNPCFWAGREFYATLACHEKAHAQGWPGDHPL